MPSPSDIRGGRKTERLPDWFRVQLPTGNALKEWKQTEASLLDSHLNTVCQEAHCPNIHQCWSDKTATFLVGGTMCTRGCRFCSVSTSKNPPPPSSDEPARIADAVKKMGLTHVVVTVVDRDDLPDFGSSHFRDCIIDINKSSPESTVEFLGPDFGGNHSLLAAFLVDIPIKVFAHNVECVPRLDSLVRDQRASFSQSVEVLRAAKRFRPDLLTKSSLMVGLGESDEEVTEVMKILERANVDLLTIGQYLPPTPKHLPVSRYPTPESFAAWKEEALEIGFKGVASGPFVRSSYGAAEMFKSSRLNIVENHHRRSDD